MTICYPVRKSKYFDDWRFVRGRFNDEIGRARSKNAESDIDPLGTSIEGIRVTSSTPGYDEKPIIAMAKLTGGQRPRTNVARTDLDSGDHFKDTLSDIYTAYLEHIKEETDQLYTKRSYSLAWAVESAQFIIKPLGNEKPTDENIFEECLKEIPTILIEENSERNPATRAELESTDEVWSVDSSLLRRADQLFRDLPMSKSYQNLIDGLDLPLTDLPDGKVLCNINSPRFPDATLEDRAPEKIHVIGDEKRVDIKWQTQKQDQSNFEIFPGKSLQRGADNMSILIQNESIQTKGIDNDVAVMSAGRLIILQDAKICDLLQNISSKLDPTKRMQKGIFNQMASLIIEYINNDGKKSEPSELERVFKDEFGHRGSVRESTELIDIDYAELLQGLNELHDNTFDPEIWFDRFSEEQ
jgi:hypothetical protein